MPSHILYWGKCALIWSIWISQLGLTSTHLPNCQNRSKKQASLHAITLLVKKKEKDHFLKQKNKQISITSFWKDWNEETATRGTQQTFHTAVPTAFRSVVNQSRAASSPPLSFIMKATLEQAVQSPKPDTSIHTQTLELTQIAKLLSLWL